MPISTKFTIADLAAVIFSISIFLAGAKWLRDSQVLDSVYCLPSIPVDFTIGLGVAPFVEMALLAAQIFMLTRGSLKPHTILLYLGFLVFGFTIPESATTRHFIILLVTSTASVIECRMRTRSETWYLMPLMCFGITLCYYLITMAALASAAV